MRNFFPGLWAVAGLDKGILDTCRPSMRRIATIRGALCILVGVFLAPFAANTWYSLFGHWYIATLAFTGAVSLYLLVSALMGYFHDHLAAASPRRRSCMG